MTPLQTTLQNSLKPALFTWAFAFAMLLFVLSLVVPTNSIPPMLMPFPTSEDKNTHVLMFTLLTLITRICFNIGWGRLLSLLVAIAAISEWIQIWVPYRNCNIQDFQANLVGIALGTSMILLFTVTLKYFNKQDVRHSG